MSREDRKNRCTYCGDEIDAEFVDNGVGREQVTPYRCHSCLAQQINPHTDQDNLTPIEKRLGWFEPDAWLAGRTHETAEEIEKRGEAHNS